jgi:hypothetical protein
MKLAHENLFIVRTKALGRAARHRGASNDGRRPNANTTLIFRRTSWRLAARWYISQKTNRLECYWSLEPLASDDQLCRSTYRNQRRNSHRSLRRNSHARMRCHE